MRERVREVCGKGKGRRQRKCLGEAREVEEQEDSPLYYTYSHKQDELRDLDQERERKILIRKKPYLIAHTRVDGNSVLTSLPTNNMQSGRGEAGMK